MVEGTHLLAISQDGPSEICSILYFCWISCVHLICLLKSIKFHVPQRSNEFPDDTQSRSSNRFPDAALMKLWQTSEEPLLCFALEKVGPKGEEAWVGPNSKDKSFVGKHQEATGYYISLNMTG
jgi:hypothetical protein